MIKENQKILNAMLAVLDACCCIISMVLAFYLYFSIYQGSTYIGLAYYIRLMLFIIPIYFVIYNYFGLHDSFRNKALIHETGKIIQANTIGVIFIFVLVFFLKEVDISRPVILLFGLFNIATTSLFRIVLRMVLRNLRKKGYNVKHILMVGWNEVSKEFFRRVTANRRLGFDIFGYFGNENAAEQRPAPLLGSLEELGPYLNAHKGIDEVIISLDYTEFGLLEGIIELCEKEGVKASLLPFYTKYLPARPAIDDVEGLPLINIRKIPLDNFLLAFSKRSFDIAASFLALLLLSPFLLMTAIGVKLTSPGPVIYRQERIGRNKKTFVMYKFRSMRTEQDGSDLTTWGTKSDDRRTKFGSFIRKCSIDELPQLFNVLKGDMSLVGPRPERPFFVEQFREKIPLYMVKHFVRPGITGWAQINGWRGDTSIEERIKCDIYYIENWTFLFDIKIMMLTVFRGFVNHSETL